MHILSASFWQVQTELEYWLIAISEYPYPQLCPNTSDVPFQIWLYTNVDASMDWPIMSIYIPTSMAFMLCFISGCFWNVWDEFQLQMPHLDFSLPAPIYARIIFSKLLLHIFWVASYISHLKGNIDGCWNLFWDMIDDRLRYI